MPTLHEGICEECGEPYLGTSERFCSWDCYVASHWIDRFCQHCGQQFSARKIYVNRGQMKYCSTECSALASREFPVIDYAGDRFYFRRRSGYYESTTTGRKLHRVIWESEHGVIPEGHVVHHVDGDTTNNDLVNLELMAWGEHSSHHNRARRANDEARA